MPAPLAPFVAFALGVLFAWLGYAEPDSEESFLVWDRKVLAVVLYAALVFVPASAYFVTFAADWSSAYSIDRHAVPSAFGLALLLVDFAALPLGYLAGRRALAKRSPTTLVWLGAAPLALVLVTLLALHKRLGIDATYSQVQSDFGTMPLAGSPLGYAILWLDALCVLGAVLVARTLTQAPSSARAPRALTEPPTKIPSPAPEVAPSREPKPQAALPQEKRLLGRRRRSP